VTDAAPSPGRPLEGYPPEWPEVALLVKVLAGWRCEHCGIHLPPGGSGDRVLTVHHLELPRTNLQAWNLVPLCLSHHALVERLVRDLDALQLSLDIAGGEPFPWLAARRRARELHPFRPASVPQPYDLARSMCGLPGFGRAAPAAISGRLCACGCGQALPPPRPGMPRRYLDHTHQVRAYRERRARQSSLLTLLAGRSTPG
jgi:hypothetical protein